MRTISVRSLLLPVAAILMASCSTEPGTTLVRDAIDAMVDTGWGGPELEVATSEDEDTCCSDEWPDIPDETFEPDDFGALCNDNNDCLSGLCVPHQGEKICTHECVEECPGGFTCTTFSSGPDMLFVCQSLAPSLCLPCGGSDACQPGPSAPAACVVYPGEGSFCASECSDELPCPEGSYCLEADVVEGGSGNYCVQMAGPCPCSQYAIATGLSTPCGFTNDFGTCNGVRKCTDAGLTACDAAVPNEEFCNGKDDDCDGEEDEETCDDLNPCTVDTCNPNQGCVFEAQDGIECDDGNPCTVAEVCVEGTCTGSPVKCNDDNPCTDDFCAEDGGCVFEPNQADCDDGDPCTVGDICKSGTCSGTAVDCDCTSDADCGALEDGNMCNGTLFCDTAKVPFQCKLVPGSVVECPAPEGKNKSCLAAHCDPSDGSCSLVPANGGAPCDDGNKCTFGEVCSDGACLSGKPLNCNDGNPCTDDSCQPGEGCVHTNNDGPCDDGDLCSLNDVCSAGECTAGAPLSCNDNNVCTNDICNPLKGCLHTNNSQACDDLDPCTEQDACSGGVCLGTVPKDCDDGNPCTNDTCIPLAGCSHNNNTNPCDDGNPCTLADKCLGGTCNPGSQLNCDDGNVCTDDSCDPAKGCIHAPNTAPCDDSNSCTSKDTCSNGKCIGSGDLDCDDGNPCTKDLCLADGGCQHQNTVAPCNDGDPCTVGDVCAEGECVPGDSVDCDDDNVCTTDSCDAETGFCLHAATDGACDDGNPCTLVDSCSGGKCIGKTPPDCNDDNVCTNDYCDPDQGCVHLLNSSPCDDGNVCTTKDVCELGECVGSSPLTCNDGNPCTDDACVPESGCSFTPNGAGCDDGNACTSDDTCKSGWCVGTTVQCSDDNVCTADACDPEAGCQHTNIQGECDDNNACTVNDACVDGACTAGPDALDCDDGNLCTDDSCAPEIGCVNTNNAAPCDDGNQCTVGDVCANGSCTAGPDPKDCNDGDSCTEDSCDPDTGCVHQGSCALFSHAFSSGPTTGTACTKWNQWRATLTGNYTKVTIRGSKDMNGVSCTGGAANQICQALRTGQAGSWSCGGRNWRTGDCGGPIEVNANGNMCSCGPGYTVRPCIDYPGSPNPNWGGANTDTCNSPSQTLEVLCQ